MVSGGCGPFHRERRVFLHQELERMATAFVDVPGLLPQKIQVGRLRALLLCLGCRILGFEGVNRGSTGEHPDPCEVGSSRGLSDVSQTFQVEFLCESVCAETKSWTPP